MIDWEENYNRVAEHLKTMAYQVAELESDLASERAKRVEAEAALLERVGDDDLLAELVRDNVARVVALKATIADVKHEVARDWASWHDRLDEISTLVEDADTSALARHDSEVAARALEEAADDFAEREGVEATMLADDNIEAVQATEAWLRARAAEKRAEHGH